MSFRLKANPTFWRTVNVRSLDGEEFPLQLELKHRRKSELREFVASLEGRTDEELVADLVVGWKDVDAEFSPEALTDLLEEYSGAAVAIWTEYQKAYAEAARKN